MSSASLIRHALGTLPAEFQPTEKPTVLKHGLSGNVVLRVQRCTRDLVLKIYRAQKPPTPLLPTAEDCAGKTAWLSTLPNLRGLVPPPIYTSKLSFGKEVQSLAIYEYIDGVSAASAVHNARLASKFAALLGELCSQLHATSIDGFGAVFDLEKRRFTHKTWADYLAQRLGVCDARRFSAEVQKLGPPYHNFDLDELFASAIEFRAPVLYHHDLLQNWTNTIVDPTNLRPLHVLDWDRAGGGNSYYIDLAVARFSLRHRTHSTFNWPKFLTEFLSGYGTNIKSYRNQDIAIVNALSVLYAARCAQLDKTKSSASHAYAIEAISNRKF